MKALKDPEPVTDPVDHIGTHDNAFTRGAEYGYVLAMIEHRIGFERWLISTHMNTVVDLLVGSGANIRISARRLHGPFGIQQTFLRVEWP